MAKILNLARVSCATQGTGSLALGGAVEGFKTFADAGAAEADIIAYAIRDGANSELGYGTYSAGTLTRTVRSSTNNNNAISLTGNAEVFSAPSAAEIAIASAIVVTPAGNLAATNVQAALEELDSDLTAHLNDTTAAHAASAVSFAPTGSLSSTTVQAALAEVDGDVTAHLLDATDAHDASAISFVPAGALSSTTAQAAIAELDLITTPGIHCFNHANFH